MAALATLNRPGRPRAIGYRSPPAVTRSSPSTQASRPGRAKSQPPHDQSPSGEKAMRPPQEGQPTASSCHTWPAPTHRTAGASRAAQTTMGSSAFATTTQSVSPGSPDRAARQRSTSMRTSAMRSSWSRDRLSRTTTAGRVCTSRWGRYPSSTSSTAQADRRSAARAATWPAGMLAPVVLETTVRPAPSRAAASSRVVVVLPLVPVTTATRRPRPSSVRRPGSTARPARPPITVPLPRPRRRDVPLTAATAATAARARAGSGAGDGGGDGWYGSVTPAVGPGPRPAR